MKIKNSWMSTKNTQLSRKIVQMWFEYGYVQVIFEYKVLSDPLLFGQIA